MSEQLMVRRCRRCGVQAPAFHEQCMRCAGAMGHEHEKSIELLTPSLPYSDGQHEIAIAAVLALELSCSDALQPELSRELEMFERELAGWDADRPQWSDAGRGIVCATFAASSIEAAGTQAAACAWRAFTLSLRRLELRGGLTIGLTGLSNPLESDTAQVAIQLARVAAANRVLMSYATARVLEDVWAISPGGPDPRRPSDRGRQGLSLAGPRRAPPPPSALVRGRHPTLVGRERELALLDAIWRDAEHGPGCWCAVVAPAGGGKSALLQRWLDQALQTGQDVLGAGASPFAAAPLTLVKVLTGTLGLPKPTERSDDRATAVAIAKALRERAPVRILFEDVHWADRRSLAVMQELATTTLPGCLLICAYRRSFEEEMRWMPGVRIVLPGLTEPERTQLLTSLLPQRRYAAERQLLAKAAAGQSPLYLEQAAALIRERGRTEPLPASVSEAVLARLQLLLSSIGRHFPTPQPAEPGQVESKIGELLDRLETGDYADREVIARSLALLERIDHELVIARSIAGVPVARNRRVSSAVQRFYAASFAERISALHATAREDPLNAALAAERGARASLTALRLADATAYLECAAAWRARPEETAQALLRLGDLWFVRGDPPRAANAYRQAIATTTSREVTASARRRLARAIWLEGDLDGAAELLAEIRTCLCGRDAALADVDMALLRAIREPARGGEQPELTDWESKHDELPRVTQRALARARLRAAILAGSIGVKPLTARRLPLPALNEDPALAMAELIETVSLTRHLPSPATAAELLPAAERAVRMLGSPHAARALAARSPDWPPLHPET